MQRPMMQRPVMDPTFVKELADAKRKRRAIWWQWIVRAFKFLGRSMLSNPLVVRKPDDPFKPSFVKLFIRMAISWALFLPIMITLTALVLVIIGTHPTPAPTLADPNSQGCYFDPISFASGDGTQLSGWIIPVIDAHRVISEKDRVLRWRRPAIVLVHDFGQSPQQMLPLVKPLHDEGMVVLAIALRGCGHSKVAGETFGLKEGEDVAAAVNMLRNVSFVDREKIAVAGIGTGANAVLIAAASDPSIKAMVIANPIKSVDQMIAQRVAPHKPWLNWMEPLCRRVFELYYGVDAQNLEYSHYGAVLKSRPTLVFDTGDNFVLHEGTTIDQVRMFCRRHLNTQDLPALGAVR